MMVNAPNMGDANPQQQGEVYEEKKEGSHPDPKEIGREFVRQYYTMLAEHPKVLHRFYSNDSTFIHGDNQTEVGQTNIQKKISQLKFENCKAKIKKVDACGSKSGGVVIQVIGLLEFPERDGSSFTRRFMQTFYLAQQTQKNYYVHNDIFHYVDEVFEEADQYQPTGQGSNQERVEVRGSESSEMEQPPPQPQRIPPQTSSNNSHPQGPSAHHTNGTHNHHEDPKNQTRTPSESVYGSQMPHRVQQPSAGAEKYEETPGPVLAQPPNAHPSTAIPPPMESVQPQIPVPNPDRQQRVPSESAQSSSGPQEAIDRQNLTWADRAKGKQQPFPGPGGPAMPVQSTVQMPGQGIPHPGYATHNNQPSKPHTNLIQGMESGGGPTFGVADQTGMGAPMGHQQNEQPHHYSSNSLPRRRSELFMGSVPTGWDRIILFNVLKQNGFTGIEEVRVANTKNEGRLIAFLSFQSSDQQQEFFNDPRLNVQNDGKKTLILNHEGNEYNVSIDEKKERDVMGGGRGRGASFAGRGVYNNRMNQMGRNGPTGGGPRNHQMTGPIRGGMERRGPRGGGPGAGAARYSGTQRQ